MSKKLIALSAAALLSTSIAVAQTATSNNDGFYVSGLAGVTLKSDFSDSSLDTSFNPGYRLGAAVGRQFDQFRVEAELAYMHIRSDKVKFAGTDTGVDTDLDTVALFANGFYDIDTGSAFTPYLGLGIGVAKSDIEATAFGITIKDDETRAAYQLIAGVAYEANQNLDVTVDYRYFDTFENTNVEMHSVNAGVRYRFS